MAADKESCFYIDEKGVFRQVDSRNDIPEPYRSSAKCSALRMNTQLDAPDEIELKGPKGREALVSDIGPISLHWPRKTEKLLGKTPKRAMADAARMVSRAVKKPGFPTEIRRLDLDWNVVFLDAELPETQIPSYLVSNCHPAWMTAPSNVYVVVQRVASGCGGGPAPRPSEVDAKLAEVLAHEIGHAVEARLLNGQMVQDRMLAEGFATWFESFASDFSDVIRSGVVRKEHFELAKKSLQSQPGSWTFQGTAEDYARASLLFHAVVEDKGVRGLMKVYEVMREKKLPFFDAVKEATYWDQERLFKKAYGVVGY